MRQGYGYLCGVVKLWEDAVPEKSVYFLTDGEFVKIGKATNTEKRVAEIQRYNPRILSVIGTIPGGHAEEQELHERFASLCVKGEWFEVTGDLEIFLEQTFGWERE